MNDPRCLSQCLDETLLTVHSTADAVLCGAADRLVISLVIAVYQT